LSISAESYKRDFEPLIVKNSTHSGKRPEKSSWISSLIFARRLKKKFLQM